MIRRPPRSTLFPYTNALPISSLFLHRSNFQAPRTFHQRRSGFSRIFRRLHSPLFSALFWRQDRKSTRLNSSHVRISYAVFCLKKNNTANILPIHTTTQLDVKV